ncbi:sensor histidine kinase [Nocardia jinanensis]|uniref:Uncharacterized protein n=1 Tax=Nocardia jinanensis TaxID=382504 RepID=A0A917RWQ7_9NOCA|nr:sensor histidine kinase [Nocardia jinanensis]GGL36930.1 hypothetical protein GCM10011588_59570 [Nocardia jinanensis]
MESPERPLPELLRYATPSPRRPIGLIDDAIQDFLEPIVIERTMNSAGSPGPTNPAAVAQEVAARAARAVLTGTSEVVRREQAILGGTRQSADQLLDGNHRGKEIVDGTQHRSGPESTAGRRGLPEATDTAGRRESSGGDTPALFGNGTGEPPLPPRGAGSGADDDEPSMLLDLGGPGSPALRANADSAARVRDALTARLHGWSSPGYVDDIASAVGEVVEHGRGTVRITAATFGRPGGSRLLGIQVTHTGASQVRTIWELDQTPRTVERGPDPAPRPERETGVDGDDRQNPMWGRDGEVVNQDYQRGVSEIRRALDRHLSDNFPWLTPEQIYDARLIISELYTNSVTYSPDHRANIDITAPADGQVRISVSNALAPGAARNMAEWVPDQQSVNRQGGRGTQLAHELSAACGRELRFGTDGSSATHWFELHHSDGADAGGSDPVIDMSAFADDLADLGVDIDNLPSRRDSGGAGSPATPDGDVSAEDPETGNR